MHDQTRFIPPFNAQFMSMLGVRYITGLTAAEVASVLPDSHTTPDPEQNPPSSPDVPQPEVPDPNPPQPVMDPPPGDQPPPPQRATRCFRRTTGMVPAASRLAA